MGETDGETWPSAPRVRVLKTRQERWHGLNCTPRLPGGTSAPASGLCTEAIKLNGVTGWVLVPQDQCPQKERSGHRHAQRDGHVGHREGTAACTPRREASGGTSRDTWIVWTSVWRPRHSVPNAPAHLHYFVPATHASAPRWRQSVKGGGLSGLWGHVSGDQGWPRRAEGNAEGFGMPPKLAGGQQGQERQRGQQAGRGPRPRGPWEWIPGGHTSPSSPPPRASLCPPGLCPWGCLRVHSWFTSLEGHHFLECSPARTALP